MGVALGDEHSDRVTKGTINGKNKGIPLRKHIFSEIFAGPDIDISRL